MPAIQITLPDGAARSYPEGSTGRDLATDLGGRVAKQALAMSVGDETRDLSRDLVDGDKVALLLPNDDEGLEVIRHSTAHVMAQAVVDVFPGASFAIGPVIEDGFYYDFELPDGQTFSDEDLGRIEARMLEIVKQHQPFARSELNRADALKLFSDQSYKVEIIEGVTSDPDSSPDDSGGVTVYRNTDDFVDLCRGPHVPDTGHLGHFKLMRVAGAYWRGDESNQMLQRIYGTAWPTKKLLREHLERLEEAAKRDHRKLAQELDLLSFPELVGPGLALWHPKGAMVRSIMEDYIRQRHRDGGYVFVYTPHIAKDSLWEVSGHLDFYADSMYPPMEMDKAIYRAKPMNCPMHMTIFNNGQHSYRDLPLRMFELGTVYRYERSGTMHGLMRLRGFTQDDSHIFCTPEQMPQEIISLIEFVTSVLEAFGFDDFEASLSTRPTEKSVGDDREWDAATEALREGLESCGMSYTLDEGGGAFYGPKIDIHIKDAIGRRWQLSTIQLDFQLGPRFELSYVGSDNKPHTPVVIHRALLGSIERFFGVLIEHYAGAFPTWLAPVQVRVLGVRDDHDAFAESVVERLKQAGLRADSSEASEPLGARIRKAKLEKLPYVLVVGDEDVEADTVGVNARGEQVERGVPIESFIARIAEEVSRN
ncbi:MAG: threonine--tRNA ligase [Acidimicrobiales bacterium]